MSDKTIIGDATFIHGDCLDVMAGLPENSIDTIITDPPYGIGFMGKEWDNFKPTVIMEAMNKDKRPHKGIASQRRSNTAGTYDLSSRGLNGFQEFIRLVGVEMLRVLKPGGTLLIFGGARTYHRLACGMEDAGFILKDCIMWLYGSGFPKATDISKQLDKRAGVKRKKGGKNPDYRKNHNNKNSFREAEGRDPTPLSSEYNTAPSTIEAQQWDGWKSHGLKPAYEPILVAMKPNDGSYAENALKHGVAGLNIDGGRILVDPNDINIRDHTNHKRTTNSIWGAAKGADKNLGEKGRYPSNIILDEESAKQLDEQSGELTSGSRNTEVSRESDNNCMSGKNYARELPILSGSSGGASRFFYCAKASPVERNDGCGELPSRNNHPTVKPISLMEYLCNITRTPTGGIVIDPFMGSGTTAIACHRTNRKFIGIEKEKKYFDIAIARYRNEIKQMRICDLE